MIKRPHNLSIYMPHENKWGSLCNWKNIFDKIWVKYDGKYSAGDVNCERASKIYGCERNGFIRQQQVRKGKRSI